MTVYEGFLYIFMNFTHNLRFSLSSCRRSAVNGSLCHTVGLSGGRGWYVEQLIFVTCDRGFSVDDI